ncbi:MAG: chemotaxis protein CheB [Deltaproteobacteria bacterium]|nr:chemotaxis protein CheB [Myxococcales bacterium]MDP3216334.1 chemotaxis protein CheB [Deltaproteobacteria bacterium]
MDPAKLRLVIVNDSATIRAALRRAFAGIPDVEVVGEAKDGAEAVKVVAERRPSVVVMDIVMPVMDGYAATRQIMATCPTPIVLVSSVVNPRDAHVAMEALRSGALAIVEALPAITDPRYELRREALLHTLRSMSLVRLDRFRSSPAAAAPAAPPLLGADRGVAAIGIAASTGGPNAVVELLRLLPPGVMPPLLIVQHIARGFAEGFARWITEASGHHAAVAVDHAPAARGEVYIAPDDRYLGLDASMRIVVSDTPQVGLFRPSGNYLFESLARALGHRARGVVLTGMGDDGADGAVALRRSGGRVAAQDEATSVVYGMPRAALERGGADVVLPLLQIPAWLCGQSAV